jgi:hypothetical protein
MNMSPEDEVKKELALLEIAIADLASDPDVTIEQLERLREEIEKVRQFVIDALRRNSN